MRQKLRALGKDLRWALQLETMTVLRDRRALLYAFLVPALLYPLLMAVLIYGYEKITRDAEEATTLLYVDSLPEELQDLRLFLLDQPQVELVPKKDALALLEAVPLQAATGDVPSNLLWNFQVSSDMSRPVAAAASLRLRRLLSRYREQRLEEVATESGTRPQDWRVFELSKTNLSEGKAMGRFVQSAVLPVMFVVMVALGSFYPAIDSIAGERERGSWETSLTIAIPRMTLLFSKLLVCAALGCAAGLINAFSMSIALEVFFAELLGELQQLNVIELSPPLAALPMFFLAGAVLSVTISACMMVLASFARTFREGQAMVAPFYLVILLPALLLADPDLRLSSGNAWFPIVGLGLALRSSLLGEVPGLLVLIAITSNLVMAGLTLRFAGFVLRHEDVLEGNVRGGLVRFLRTATARAQQK